MPPNDEMLDAVHEAMLAIQARKKPGCKLMEIVAEVEDLETKQAAKHWADQLVEEGRAIRRPGAGGLRALTVKEQEALIAASAKLREDTVPWEDVKKELEGEWVDA